MNAISPARCGSAPRNATSHAPAFTASASWPAALEADELDGRAHPPPELPREVPAPGRLGSGAPGPWAVTEQEVPDG